MTSPGAALLKYIDARVRKDVARPGFVGRVCVGVKAPQPLWWVADFNARAVTLFSPSKPAHYDVAVGMDDDGAASLLGLPVTAGREPLRLVAGDAALLRRFVARYLQDVSPLMSRISAMAGRPR